MKLCDLIRRCPLSCALLCALSCALSCACALGLIACDDPSPPAPRASLDAAPPDAAPPDAAPPDAALPDAESPDAAPPDAAPPLEPTARVERLEGGGLRLTTSAPMLAEGCAECVDADLDGLSDAWEGWLLESLRPLLRFDEQEQLFRDPELALAMIGRVARAPEGGVRVYVTIAYSRDYGTCGLTAHDGDSERVAVDLRVEEGGALVTRAFYTAAHEGTLADHSRLWSDAALAELTFEEPAPGEARWVVYPSADKHATYGTIEACESISPLPCVDEDCAPNNVSYPERYDLLPPVHNAGEDAARLLDDLAPLGFPGDSAWGAQPFCGGRARLLCASPVREKLLSDPF